MAAAAAAAAAAVAVARARTVGVVSGERRGRRGRAINGAAGALSPN